MLVYLTWKYIPRCTYAQSWVSFLAVAFFIVNRANNAIQSIVSYCCRSRAAAAQAAVQNRGYSNIPVILVLVGRRGIDSNTIKFPFCINCLQLHISMIRLITYPIALELTAAAAAISTTTGGDEIKTNKTRNTKQQTNPEGKPRTQRWRHQTAPHHYW